MGGTEPTLTLGLVSTGQGPRSLPRVQLWAAAKAAPAAPALRAPEGGGLGSCAALPSRVALIFAEGPMGWWAGAAWAGLIAATLHSN